MALRFTFFVLLANIFCLSYGTKTCPAVTQCLNALDKGKKCPLLPVPPAAIAPPVPAEGFRLQKLRRGVWSMIESNYMTVIIVRYNRLVVIDFPNDSKNTGKTLLRLLKGKKPYRVDMIYSHRHTDHIGSSRSFADFVKLTFPRTKLYVWGTEGTRKSQKKNNRGPLPNIIVRKHGRTVSMGRDLNINLRIIGGHSRDDMVAHIPASRDGPGIIHYADVITPGFAPFDQFGLTVDLARYVEVHDILLKIPFKIFSPGHGKLGGKFDIRRNKRYTLDVIAAVKKSMASVTQTDLAKLGVDRTTKPESAEFGNFAWRSSVVVDLWVQRCFKDIVRKWGCELGAVDVYGATHCHTAAFFLLLNS